MAEENKTSFLGGFDFKKISLILIIIFIISLGVASYFIYKEYVTTDNTENVIEPLATTTEEETKPLIRNQNILNPEIVHSADFSKLNRGDIVNTINIIRSILTENKITPGNNVAINTNVGIRTLLEKIRYSGDEALLRSFDEVDYVLGLYSMNNNKYENYLLIKLNNFDLAFKSMLFWEKYMMVDLKDIFIGNNMVENNTNASTSTSTVATYNKKDTEVFVDKILKNYDIRTYVKNSDNLTIIYGFINNKYLLITSGESSFIDIKDRLLKENISR